MRILQVTSHLQVGGVPRYVVMLSGRLAARGHQVVVASAGGPLAAQLSPEIVQWRVPLRAKCEWHPNAWWTVEELIRRLRRTPVDLLHAHSRVSQVVAQAVSRRLGIPYVVTWHGIYRPNLGRWLWPCTGDRTIAISEPVRRHLLEQFHVPAERVRKVYNGIETVRYGAPLDPDLLQQARVRWGLPRGGPVIGGIGRMASGRVKGFDLIMAAAYLLKEEFPDLHLLLVGDGPRRPFLEGVAQRLGVADRTHFIGTTEDVRVSLALMDVFLFTSRWPEAFGLTLVEAMAAGRPVVAVNVGAVPEIVRHGQEGWLVPHEDVGAIADGIARLLRDRAMATRLGQQAQARARELFDLERMTTEIEAVYQEVVGHG